jgi:hypothetical protein
LIDWDKENWDPRRDELYDGLIRLGLKAEIPRGLLYEERHLYIVDIELFKSLGRVDIKESPIVWVIPVYRDYTAGETETEQYKFLYGVPDEKFSLFRESHRCAVESYR